MIKTHAIERMRELAAAQVPFVHQGRDFAGIDCVGAIAYAFQHQGEIPAYPENPVNGELERNLIKELGAPIYERPFDFGLLIPCDIVSMQYAGPERHVALVVPHINIKGQLSIIHTDSRLGRVTEHILDRKWLRRIVKVWRL